MVHAYSTTSVSLFLSLAIGVLFALGLLVLFSCRQLVCRTLLVSVLVLLAFAVAGDWGQFLLKLNPVLVNMALAWLFFCTTLGTRTPLITRFASAIGDELDAATRRYTRVVTIVWAVFFALLGLESALLAVWASPQSWSLITGFLNYVLVGAVFPIEYCARRYFLPHQTRKGFCAFVKSLMQADFRRLLVDR